MKTIIVIHEECHGQIGIATTYKAALQWLIKSAWVECFTDVALPEEGDGNSVESCKGFRIFYLTYSEK